MDSASVMPNAVSSTEHRAEVQPPFFDKTFFAKMRGLFTAFVMIPVCFVLFELVSTFKKTESAESVISTVHNATRVTAEIIKPSSVWPVIVLGSLLVATVDSPYFPTLGIITGYVTLMFYHGFFFLIPSLKTLITFSIGAVVWIVIGGVWLGVKWWSFLRDPKNSQTVAAVPDGGENQFFFNRLPYLYPHFLYWPLSIPHTIMTRLIYQIFEHLARRWSGYFGRMVRDRKAELAVNVAN